MIPRRLFWVFDPIALILAFVLAYYAFPVVRPLGNHWSTFLEFAAPSLAPHLSPVSEIGRLEPLPELAWILVIVLPPALLVLGAIASRPELTKQSNLRTVAASLLAMAAGLGLAALVLFALRSQDWSRLFLFLFGAFGVVLLSGYRFLARRYIGWRRRAGYYTRNVLAIGSPATAADLARHIEQTSRPDEYRVVGYLDTDEHINSRQATNTPTETLATPRRLGSIADLKNLLMQTSIQNVVAVLPDRGGEWIDPVVAACDEVGMPIQIVPECLLDRRLFNLHVSSATDPLRLPALDLKPLQWSPEQIFIKRIVDILLAGLGIVMLSPLLAIIAVTIRLTSPGPLLYYWKVIGQHGRAFVGYKFRTMVENADSLKADLLPHNEMRGPVFKMANDPRVTPFGRFLRKYSLDELPQLFNVLKGDMSLVGPRPGFRSEVERYEFWHKRKFSIRPGMTCLWQVRGRNAIDNFDEWVRLDLEYIDNWSLWLDFKILLWTIRAVIAGTGR